MVGHAESDLAIPHFWPIGGYIIGGGGYYQREKCVLMNRSKYLFIPSMATLPRRGRRTFTITMMRAGVNIGGGLTWVILDGARS